MNWDSGILKNEEKILFGLRALYRQYGYAQFRMRKFEEYDLYAGNKDFLVSGRVITFQDTDGKLLALKPDVTLSIVRSGGTSPGRSRRSIIRKTSTGWRAIPAPSGRSCRPGSSASARWTATRWPKW